MKNSVKKITAAALCTVLIAGSVGITAFAENKTDSDSTTAPIVETAAEEVIEENGAEKKEEKSESARFLSALYPIASKSAAPCLHSGQMMSGGSSSPS